MAFKIAGSMGFKEGCRKADPVLLEPIMRVDVIVPEDYMGDVIGGLSSATAVTVSKEWKSGAESQADHRQKFPFPRCSVMPQCLRSSSSGSRNIRDANQIILQEVPQSVMEEILKK